MLLQILAAAAAAATPPAADPPQRPANTVSPVIVSPETKPPPADVKINMQGGTDDVDQMVVIWPGDAYHTRRDGQVTLRCLVDPHGLAERCDVASEEPKGHGFGKAALEMRVTFKLPPTLGPDGPISAVKNIALSFKAPDTDVDYGAQSASMHMDASKITVSHNALELHPVTMLDYPVWAAAADFDDLAKAYPARGGGAEGYAVAHCKVARDGVLSGCQVIKETPEHADFGKAATTLAAAKFRVIPALAAGRHDAPLWVDVPIRLPPPTALADRTVMAPAWLTSLDPNKAPKLFPPEAASAGLTSGRGVARCTVSADGTMAACVPEAAEPDGLGFSEAAAKLASGMKMNLWSSDGAPVAGGVVHIPVRLNLKAAN